MSDLLFDALNGTQSRNSHAQVVAGIGRAIITGRYPVDSSLPRDDELAEEYGVSRTVLREAMKTLSAKGLIVARTRVGTKVRPRTAWNLFDAELLAWHLDADFGVPFLNQLYEMRLSMEPFGAGLAAERSTPDQTAAMYRHIDAMRTASNEKSFALADLGLHKAVIESSGNAFMFSVGTLIEAALLTSFRLSSPASQTGLQAEVVEAHLRIVDAIDRRDVAGAQGAMRHVIEFGRGRVQTALKI
ncbi:MAG: FadR/GntR family transcriptional regulator [Paracoccaceae bacterium]